MTIHQPSSQIFYLFDKLLLMANGKVAYYGKASEVLDFFERAGFKCEEHFNPADYILEVLSRGAEVEEKISSTFQAWTKEVHQSVENNTSSDAKQEDISCDDIGLQNMALACDEDNSLSHITVDIDKTIDSDHEDKWPTSFWTQFCVLSHRTFKQSASVIFSKLVLIQNMLVALIIGLLWFQLAHKEETIQDRRGLIFFVVLYWGTNPMFRALLVFPSEEAIIRKERAAGSYRLSAYFFAKCMSEAPLVICQPIMFLFIFYWMCGLNPSVAFLGQAFNLVLGTILSESIGMAIGAAVMSFDKAIVVASVSMLTSMLLGGFYVNNIPFWLEWIRYLSFFQYSYENSLILEFTGIKQHSCGEVQSNFLSCSTNATTTITGKQILEQMGIERTFGENVAILFAFIVVCRVIAYCSLRFFHKPE